MDIKGEINSNTVIIGDFNSPLTSMGRSSRQKIDKETAALKETLDHMDLIDFFRAFYPKAAECTYFSSTHRTFSGTCQDTKQVSINLRRLKLHQASSLSTML